MKRIEKTFNKLKQQNKKAFSTFLMSGYPTKEKFVDLMHICAQKGVDFIEVGMPFSDPSADGPIVKKAGAVALNNGTTVKSTLDSIKEFRKTNNNTPVIWMGYFNSIYNYGIEKFMLDITESGVDSLLIVDLPVEEYDRIESEKYDIDIIRLITPNTPKERIDKILKGAGGFIYFVSINGITGTKEASIDIKQSVEYIKTRTSLPIIAGFGIKTPQKAAQMNEFTDGVIVGSALLANIDRADEFLDEFFI